MELLNLRSISSSGDIYEILKDNADVKLCACVIAIGIVGVAAVHQGKDLWLKRHMNKIRENKAAKRNTDIETWAKSIKRLSEAKEEEIICLKLPELIDRLQNDSLSATEVLQAYQHAAMVAHQKTNCLVEPIWEAMAMAEECDKSPLKKGPLHGVPISVKDNYQVRGYDSSLACPILCNQPASTDAVIVQVLKDLGAIPFVRTTIPHTMLSLDTSSPMWGQTTCKFDPGRTAGGSSGGEGALLSMRGSVFGLAGDVGGSIRVPCHFNGVYGIKPTSLRTSKRGTKGVWKGQNLIRAGYGPMARDVDSLVTAMKIYLNPKLFQLDSSVPPIEFNDEIYNDKSSLRIGYYEQNGFFECTPACARAVREAKKALEARGHQLVAMDVKEISRKANDLYFKVLSADRGRTLVEMVKGDNVGPAMKETIFLITMPKPIKMLLSTILKPFIPTVAEVLCSLNGCDSVYEWYNVVEQVETFRNEVSDAWKALGVDAVISPGFACPTMMNGTPARAGTAFSYSNMYNVLDFPCGSLPVSTVTVDDEAAMADYPTPNKWHRVVKESSSSGTVGLPLGVQVATLPWKEELCLRVMKELDVVFNNNGSNLLTRFKA